MDPVALITADVIERYRSEGVVHLRRALHPEWLRLLEMGLQRVLGDAGQAKHLFFDGQPEQFVETVRNFEVTPEIQRLLYDSPIADMVSVLIGSERIWLYSDEFFIKGSGAGRTPWHQDLPYWPLAGEQIASMWISLDPLPKDECLEYIPGSHREILYDGFNPRVVAQDPKAPFYGEEFPPLPDIEAERHRWNIISWDIDPGDVILAHPAVLHGGGGTGPTGKRRAITIRLFGEDVVYASRPTTRLTTPQTPGLSLQLKPGDPLRHPWYPRIRPRPPWQTPGW